ncbi:ras-related protein Rab-34-like [Nilaparvata lugens]|uniref:ras-related protein Rab-34-like n=1 Tax=Nilaparvata lugens TaxID=108931 RepID=UPI00193E3DFF|nr:ras-related protein Rab-34-like [Nilaparvata lugens]
MSQRRSSTFKMLRTEAPLDRQIDFFPRPFKRDATPYPVHDFNKLFKEYITSKCVVNGLKISKTIVLGDVGVGKTCLVNRFCHQVYDRNYKATIGVDFEVERFDIFQIPFNMQIWDTAGQERFKSIASSYYRGAHSVVVVFEMSKLMTLSHCAQWMQDALQWTQQHAYGRPHCFLVGTKMDLLSPSAYERVIAELWAVSSQSGENVNELFNRIAALAFQANVCREMAVVDRSISIGSIQKGEYLREIFIVI